jgi:hypothetical protein
MISVPLVEGDSQVTVDGVPGAGIEVYTLLFNPFKV